MANDESNPPKERRKGPRVSPAKPLPARVRMVADAFIRNLSAGGALIESSRALAPGSHCEVHLDLGGVTATLKARVVRCHLMAGSGSGYEAGLEFDQLDEKSLSAIAKIVKTASNGRAVPGTIRA